MQFMLESIKDLDSDLERQGGRLYLFYGEPTEVLERLWMKMKFDAVFVNRDYTPFSKERDASIQEWCNSHQVEFFSFDDCLLTLPEVILNERKEPITVFTRFYNKAKLIPVPKPIDCFSVHWCHSAIEFAVGEEVYSQVLPHPAVGAKLRGGRKEGLKWLRRALDLVDYAQLRDVPSAESTTYLSAYLKFGCLSPREVFHTLCENHPESESILRQLYWRDFFTWIAFYYPRVFGGVFNLSFSNVWWNESEIDFERWKFGETGFPLVDAGMRELNATGWMHNRVRLVTASFLTKDLHVHWRWGERYFAQRLLDYDPCVNNGNWQWVAGTGCDAQPYFRVFNPWLQAKKFDPDAKYIKTWIPELRDVPSEHILAWWTEHKRYEGVGYPPPMVDHNEEAEKSKMLFKTAKGMG